MTDNKYIDLFILILTNVFDNITPLSEMSTDLYQMFHALSWHVQKSYQSVKYMSS